MTSTRLMIVSVMTLSFACTRETSAPPVPSTTPAIVAAPSAGDALDRMDTRVAVPLLPMMANHQKKNMRDHLVVVQEIVAALAIDDFTAVEKAAGRIAFTDQMGQMCSHMGAGAPGFSEQAIGFHRTADRIVVAARERDRGRVLTELGATLQTCTACHAVWKQRVVDESSWQALTNSTPPTPGAGH